MGLGGWLKERVGELVDSQLGPEFQKRANAIEIRQNEYGYDSFGFHKGSLRYGAWVAKLLYRNYFRAETHGIENVPPGRVLLVANHSGQLPFDALVIWASMFFEPDPPRVVRSMVEKFIPTMPFVSYLITRLGQITGTPENCRRLLVDDEAILVFPEGVRGISKPYTQKYQLQDFGLGFMRLALETDTPIVPIAVIGAEEQAPAINVKALAKLLGAPALPLTPIPPFFPIVPLPVKYRLYFGEPLRFDGDPDDDDEVIGDKVRTVKNSIQSMIQLGLKERKHVFW